MTAAAHRPVRRAVPFYLHPAERPGAWRALTEGAGDLAFAVVNIADGPGLPDDPYYGPVLARGSRTRLLGYVPVGYGRRAPDEVRRDAATWRDRYGIAGLMLDEVPAVPALERWSLDVIGMLRGDGADLVVANPGTPPDPDLIGAADVTCVAEYPWSQYARWSPPPALRDVPPDRLWHLIHSCPPGRVGTALARAATLGAGYAWVTPGGLPHPWGALPPGWQTRDGRAGHPLDTLIEFPETPDRPDSHDTESDS